MREIELIKLRDEAVLPNKGTVDSAGFDLSASLGDLKVVIIPGEHKLISTGISIAIPNGYFGMICPRSGIALKYGVTILNSPGIIDSDYRGEIKCILINHGNEDFIITDGMRIAQLIILKYADDISFKEVQIHTEKTVRGENGFGSTGMKKIR